MYEIVMFREARLIVLLVVVNSGAKAATELETIIQIRNFERVPVIGSLAISQDR
jgi:hypothetical protein